MTQNQVVPLAAVQDIGTGAAGQLIIAFIAEQPGRQVDAARDAEVVVSRLTKGE